MMLLRFLRNKSGATAIEYALIGMLVAVAIVGGVGAVSTRVVALWESNNTRLDAGFANNPDLAGTEAPEASE